MGADALDLTAQTDAVVEEASANGSSQIVRRIVIAIAVIFGSYVVFSLMRGRKAATNEEVLETVSSIDEGTPDSSAT